MVQDMTIRRNGGEVNATIYIDDSSACVVMCPPHPLYGGSRHDYRLVKIAVELANRKISALCIDYTKYACGVEEVKDVLTAISYMSERGEERILSFWDILMGR